MRNRLLLFIVVCVFSIQFVDFSSVRAQADIPLVIHINGQIYRWSPGDAEPVPTGCDFQGGVIRREDYSLVLSPTGEWASAMIVPAGRVEEIDTSGNLWLCNISTGEAYPLTMKTETIGMYAVSEGVFSPDGSRIAWTEFSGDSPDAVNATLFVHDLAAKNTTALAVDIPLAFYSSGFDGAPRVIWSEHGLAVPYLLEDGTVGFAHYADDGTLLNSLPVPGIDANQFEWLDGEAPIIAYLYNEEGTNTSVLHTINMQTGEDQAEEAALEAFIPGSADDAGTYAPFQSNFFTAPKQIHLPASDFVLETSTDVALSPDSQTMALLLGVTLYFSDNDNGTLTPAPWNLTYFPISEGADGINIPEYNQGQFEIAWAAPRYRLTSIPETVCPSVPQLNASLGLQIVTGLGENNVRTAPSTAAPVIGSLAEGTEIAGGVYNFSTFQAPPVEVCSEGIRWHELLFDGQLGWTAESQGDTYYLQDPSQSQTGSGG
jgi:hypothetical protein